MWFGGFVGWYCCRAFVVGCVRCGAGVVVVHGLVVFVVGLV